MTITPLGSGQGEKKDDEFSYDVNNVLFPLAHFYISYAHNSSLK